MNKFRKKVYISGPYSKGDRDQNTRDAIMAGIDVLKAGFAPFVPHLTHFMELQGSQPWEIWMEMDFPFIPGCIAVIRLPGESRGSDMETAYAKELGIPIYNSVEEFLKKEKP